VIEIEETTVAVAFALVLAEELACAHW